MAQLSCASGEVFLAKEQKNRKLLFTLQGDTFLFKSRVTILLAVA